jgi:hypothetical protein
MNDSRAREAESSTGMDTVVAQLAKDLTNATAEGRPIEVGESLKI